MNDETTRVDWSPTGDDAEPNLAALAALLFAPSNEETETDDDD